MIKSVTVINHLGESKQFILSDPYSSGAIITNIEGIGPPKASINITDMATMDGGLFNSSRAETRNIVLYFRLLEHPTVEDSRQETYKFFPIKKRVSLIFETDNRTCEAYGYVESNEPDIFSKEETAQISVICSDPYFYEQGMNSTVFYGIEKAFEFIFSNESLDTELIEFSKIRNENEQHIIYNGDEDIGVLITIHAVGRVKNITIFNLKTREQMRINTDKIKEIVGEDFGAPDDILISTVKGDKYAKILHDGVYTNILNCLDKNVDWFQLSKGENIFAFVAEEGIENIQLWIDNRTIFEGV